MIVKIQIAFNAERYLVYNEDNTFVKESPLTQTIRDAMNGELKRFFFAKLDDDGDIMLGQIAPWQDW